MNRPSQLTAPGETGFTLIEVIVTLVIAALFGTMIFTYFANSLGRSVTPVIRVQQAFQLQQVMENVIADYRKNLATDLPGLKSKIGAENQQMDNGYGKYTVEINRFVKFNASRSEIDDPAGAELLKVAIKNEAGEELTLLFSSR